MINILLLVLAGLILLGTILMLWRFYEINFKGRKISTPLKRLHRFNIDDLRIEILVCKEEKLYDPKTQEEAVKRVLGIKVIKDALED